VINVSTEITIEHAKNFIEKVRKLVESIDLYELMLVEILDYADWLVREYTRDCKEYAEKKSRKNHDLFNALYITCLYQSKNQLKEELTQHVDRVVESAITLFGVYYNFQLPRGEEEFYKTVDKIVKEALTKFYPYEILIYENTQSNTPTS